MLYEVMDLNSDTSLNFSEIDKSATYCL